MKKFILAVLTTLVLIPAQAQLVHSTTITKIKEPRKILWYVRAGVSMNNATGSMVSEEKKYAKNNGVDCNFGVKAGCDFEIGFQKPLGNSGVYYNLALALGSNGYKETVSYSTSEVSYGSVISAEATSKESLIAYNVKLLPVTFGYKYAITPDIKLDAHLGLFVAYNFAGSFNRETSAYGYIDGIMVSESQSEFPGGWSYFKDVYEYDGGDCGMQLGIGAWYKKLNLDFTWQRGFVNQYGALSDKVPSQSFCTSNFMIRLGIGF